MASIYTTVGSIIFVDVIKNKNLERLEKILIDIDKNVLDIKQNVNIKVMGANLIFNTRESFKEIDALVFLHNMFEKVNKKDLIDELVDNNVDYEFLSIYLEKNGFFGELSEDDEKRIKFSVVSKMIERHEPSKFFKYIKKEDCTKLIGYRNELGEEITSSLKSCYSIDILKSFKEYGFNLEIVNDYNESLLQLILIDIEKRMDEHIPLDFGLDFVTKILEQNIVELPQNTDSIQFKESMASNYVLSLIREKELKAKFDLQNKSKADFISKKKV